MPIVARGFVFDERAIVPADKHALCCTDRLELDKLPRRDRDNFGRDFHAADGNLNRRFRLLVLSRLLAWIENVGLSGSGRSDQRPRLRARWNLRLRVDDYRDRVFDGDHGRRCRRLLPARATVEREAEHERQEQREGE